MRLGWPPGRPFLSLADCVCFKLASPTMVFPRSPYMRFIPAVSALALALSMWAGTASASILYTFAGVTFDDGGTLTGTFTTDDPIVTLLDYDITTSPGVGTGFNF